MDKQPKDLETLSDEELCDITRLGRRDAEDILAKRYAWLVRCVARPYFLAGGDSEDLIQEGMIGFLTAIREYKPGKSSFKTFAYYCVRSRVYDALKQAQGKNHSVLSKAVPMDQTEADEDSNFVINPQDDPEAFVIHRDEQRQIAAELDALLSDFEKSVLSLYLDGLSFSEMAKRLNRPVKSIDNAVTRIRNKLSPRLKRFGRAQDRTPISP